jgi:hypothetical protein
MKYRTIRIFSLSITLMAIVAMPLSTPKAEQAELLTVDQVLERYVEAVGGREAIEKLTTRVSRLEAIHDLNWTDPKIQKVPMEAFAKTPYLVLWKERKPEGMRIEGYDGTTFWHSEGGETAVREEPIPLKFRFIYDPMGPLNIEYYFPSLSVESIEEIQGRKCYKLHPEDLQSAHFALYFDVESGLLTHIGYYWNIEDYREVDGIMIPFTITISRKGGSSTFEFESIEHNIPLEDEMFSVPANNNN